MNKYSLKNLVIDFTLFLFILSLVALASIHIVKAETSLANRLSGKILLQVEDNGEAWYLNPQDNKRSYLGRPHDAYNIMREEGIGITNDNLEKIPLSLDNLSGKDSDSDKLPDNFEIAIGTDPNNSDTDSDGYDDYVEVLNNYSPKGDNAKRQTIDKSFAKSHQGKIFIQVEGNGEAWYVDTTENKRHYLGRPSDAFSIMRHLGLGISNTNLNQITIREGKGIQEYDYEEEVVDNSDKGKENSENKEEYKNHITVTTHKPELMREFSNIIHVSATINDSSGYDFKEKGFLFDYTMNKEEVLTPTLANHKEKLIDNSPGLSIEAEIDNLLPKSYPYIRAYVITAEDIVYYGNTEVLILGNTESIDSIGAPGTPPMFGGGGGGGSSTPKPEPEPVYYDLIYTAGDNGYLATTAPEVIEEPEIPEWESETNMPDDLLVGTSQIIGDNMYIIAPTIDDGIVYDSVDDFNLNEITSTNNVYRYNLISQEWDYASSLLNESYYTNLNITNSFVVDEKIYFFSLTYEASNGLIGQVYDPNSDSWTYIEELFVDNHFEFLTGGVYDNKIYIIGEAEELNGYLEINIYDPETDIWELGDTIPYNGYDGDIRSLIINDTFYIFDSDLPFENIISYKLSTNELNENIASVPGGEIMGNIINYNDNLLYLGGMIVDFERGDISYSDKVYLYIENTNSWTEIFTLPQANVVIGAIAVSGDSRLYLSGGVNNMAETYMNHAYPTAINSNYSIDLSFLTEEYISSLSDTNWQTKNPLPYSLTGAGSVKIDDTIYLVGGYSNDFEGNSPLIMSYNSDSDEWTEEALIPSDPGNMLNQPLEIVNPMTVNIGDDIYIFGGRTDEYGNASSSLKYNITTQEFTKLPDMSFEITNPFGGVYDNKIYIFGGEIVYGELPPPIINFGLEKFDKNKDYEIEENLDYQATDFFFEIYNPDTNSFEEGDIMPTSYGYGTEAILVDGIFYIIGGHNDDWSFSNQTLSYNPETDTWNTLANLPQLRAGGSLAYNNGNIYYIGGFNDDRDNIKDNIYKYDISTNTWSELSDNTPQPLSKSSAQFIEDNLYVIGGWDYDLYTSDAIYSLEVIEEDVITLLEQSVLEGSNGSEVYAVANDGYQFDSWSDGNSSNPRTDINVQSNINVTANFTETPYYTLTYQSDESSHLLIGEETDWNISMLLEEVTDPITGVIGDDIYIYGGNTGDGYSNNLSVYNTNDYSVTDITRNYLKNPNSTYRSRAAEVVYNNKIYFFGGSDSPFFNPTDYSTVIDTENKTISNLSSMSKDRIYPVAGEYNNEIYVFGGDFDMLMPTNSESDFETQAEICTFEIFNPETNSWRSGGMCPFDVIYNIVKVDDKFYISGSLGIPGMGYYSYDPETDNWEELSPNDNVFELGPGVNYYGDKVLYVGGETTSHDVSNNIYIYDISDDEWMVSGYSHGESLVLFDLQMVDEKIYILNGRNIDYHSFASRTNMSTSIYNFPFNEYSINVQEGSDGPNIYANSNIAGSGSFIGWSDSDTSNPRKDRNVTSDIDVTANFEINNYDVVFNANSGTGTMDNQTITFNTSANLTNNLFTREGYTFTGWATTTDGVVAYTDGSSFTMDVEGITLYAQWEMDCGDDVTFTYNGEEVTYGVVGNPDTGMCWLDRNLGATQVATASDDPLSYGDLFQWGRGDDGHQERTSNTTSTLSSGDVPGHNNFILVSSPYDWRSPQNDNLWQGVDGVNNPCPSGFRLPTSAELEAEKDSWSSINSLGAFNSPLKWSVAGHRSNVGSLFSVGSNGGVWSSSVSGSNSSNLYFHSSGAGISTSRSRANGYSVRCLRSNDNNSNDYDVVFDANGGTGTMSNQTITFNTSANLTANSYTRANYTFTGWATTTDGVVAYTDGSSFTMDVEGITLYAQWEMDCGDDVTFTYNGSEVTYGVVGNPDTGMCWLDRNLGATQVATALDDPLSYGDLFQWGRGDDGHQERTSNTTSTLSSGDDPGHSNFITSLSSSPFDWRSPQNDNLWQGETGINNPCPSGFRLPTIEELNDEINSWSSSDSSGAFNSPLKWSVAGRRSVNGSLYNVGSYGYIWSSSVSGSDSSYLNLYSSGAGVSYDYRADGYSVRCLRD